LVVHGGVPAGFTIKAPSEGVRSAGAPGVTVEAAMNEPGFFGSPVSFTGLPGDQSFM
jgi:hypothetical protein